MSDLASARAFYGGVLGLPSVPHPGPRTAARFRVNGRQAIVVAGGLPQDQDERLDHLAFETDSVDRMAAWLKAQGFVVETPPPPGAAGGRTSCGATRAIHVKDPDGHPVEFVEAATPPGDRSGAAADAARQERPASERVLHAGLTVRDAAGADRFYRTALGFSEIWRGGRTDGVTSWINMRVPDGTDYLEYMLIEGPVSRQQLGVLHHVALLVPDIQAAYERVTRRTPDPARAKLAAPQVGRNNRWQLNLYDPDGTRVELMEPFTMR